jgi:hypothetical protein
LALLLAACGDDEPGPTETVAAPTSVESPVATGPAATEASPEAADPTETGELSDEDEAAVTAAVNSYIRALNRRDADAVCSLHEPGSLPISELPVRRADCRSSLAASLGHARPGGTPVWKRTTIHELKEVSVGPDRARVTASVTHQFADRKYPSVEDDVIYLDRQGDVWLLAKPSGTLYRAVGYPEPPLRSLTPP